MESHGSCPICFEIPEKEIYQCSSGHIICSICIKNLAHCPQCRIPYGSTKIRSRILEEILDTQQFDCRFKTEGCTRMCKRAEITTHGNSCRFNPDFIPVCEILGYKRCKFSFSFSSRAEIVSHLKDTHGLIYETGKTFLICYGDFKTVQREGKTRMWTPLILGLGDDEVGPLVLILSKINSPTGFMSWTCIKIWDSERAQNVEVDLSILTEGESTSNSSKARALPISWKLNAYPIGDLKYFQECSPINIPLRIMIDNFLNADSSITVKVSGGTNDNTEKKIWIFCQPFDKIATDPSRTQTRVVIPVRPNLSGRPRCPSPTEIIPVSPVMTSIGNVLNTRKEKGSETQKTGLNHGMRNARISTDNKIPHRLFPTVSRPSGLGQWLSNYK